MGRIDEKTIDAVCVLAKLELSVQEREETKTDMGRMLDYVDLLSELDTEGVEPMIHMFPIRNVFREDVVVNVEDRQRMLANAPEQKNGAFQVPKTVE